MSTLSHHTRLLLVMTAQVVISVSFIGGYFLLMWQFVQGHVHVPADFKEMFMTLMGVLTSGVGIILAFWFARTRGSTEAGTPPSEPQ